MHGYFFIISTMTYISNHILICMSMFFYNFYGDLYFYSYTNSHTYFFIFLCGLIFLLTYYLIFHNPKYFFHIPIYIYRERENTELSSSKIVIHDILSHCILKFHPLLIFITFTLNCMLFFYLQ
jgi:hypothetical protein